MYVFMCVHDNWVQKNNLEIKCMFVYDNYFKRIFKTDSFPFSYSAESMKITEIRIQSNTNEKQICHLYSPHL